MCPPGASGRHEFLQTLLITRTTQQWLPPREALLLPVLTSEATRGQQFGLAQLPFGWEIKLVVLLILTSRQSEQ